ncbi:hypothetical protein Q7O_001082 [Pectobacterium carotovorum subsp. carotovorum PCCS1]|nr:hypothetical protein [Pectobacterium carotovorum subsp. carotovorum PCCS1]
MLLRFVIDVVESDDDSNETYRSDLIAVRYPEFLFANTWDKRSKSE